MTCTKCSAEVEAKDMFCRKCGEKLQHPPVAQTLIALTPELARAKDESIEAFRREAKLVQTEVVDAVQDKADKYMEKYFSWLTKIAGAIMVCLTILGLSTWSNFNTRVEESLAKIDKTSNDAQSTITSKKASLDSTFESVKIKMKILDKSMAKINKIDSMHNEASGMVSNINAGFKRMDGKLRDADKTLKDVRGLQDSYQRIKNSEIDLVVQTNARTIPENTDTTTRFGKLLNTITQNGYVIRKSNLLASIGVDKTEVIYYGPESAENALTLVKYMNDVQYNAQPHFISNSNAGANLILIKLKIDE